ncbi:MAG: DUF2927 domain-containing protein [Rhizobiales bacterium]|nr:DUF2927 domain-containing protein [Hyphomicrobiales bacterium]
MSVPTLATGGTSVARFRLRPLVLAGAALTLASAYVGPAGAENAEIARRRAEQRTTFSDAEITGGFLKIAFGAEYNLAGRVDRIRKFDGPVWVYVENRGKPDRRAQVTAVVAHIHAHVEHLDIAMTNNRRTANVVVRLVRNRDIPRTIRTYFGRGQADRIQRTLDPQCLSGFRKDAAYRIQHADVILPVDAGDFVFYDCAYEELLQALGPINDDPSVPWTMFNDNVQLGFFGIYDQYLLNILYDPRIRPGMTVAEVRAKLPAVLPTVRAYISKTNGIPP